MPSVLWPAPTRAATSGTRAAQLPKTAPVEDEEGGDGGAEAGDGRRGYGCRTDRTRAASGDQELAQLLPGVHANKARSPAGTRGSLPVPPSARLCHTAADGRSLGPGEFADRLPPAGGASSPTCEGLHDMSDKKVWFVTGAGRGMGVDIAQAALAAGHAVVATGRNADRVSVSDRRARRPAGGRPGRHRPRERAGPPSTPPSSGSAGSTSWSTTPATSTPGSSRRSARRTSGPRSRPTCSAR